MVVCSILLFLPMSIHQILSSSTSKGDFPAHLAAAQHLLQGRLEDPQLLFHGLVALLSLFSSIGIAATFVVIASQVAVSLLVFEALLAALSGGPYDEIAAPLAWLASFSLVIAGPISFVTFPNLMLGYLTPTTYHNPTIIVLKPLALGQFLLTVRVFFSGSPESTQARPRGLLALTVVTFLGTLAKPAYAIAAIPAVILCLFAYRRTLDVRQKLSPVLWVGTAAGLVLAWQYVFLYGTGSSDEGIAWAPLVVLHGFEPSNARLAVKTVLSLAFPLSVALGDLRATLKDRPLVFCWVCLAISLFYDYLFMERGPRSSHGNLGWGVLITLFLLFFQSLVHLLRRMKGGAVSISQKVSFALFGTHVVAGVVWYLAMFDAFAVCGQLRFGWCW